MDKKIIIALVLVAFLMALVVAVEVINKDVDVNSKQLERAVKLGIEDPDYNDTIEGERFIRTLISRSEFNLPSSPDSDRFRTYKFVCSSWNETVILNNGSFFYQEHSSPDLLFTGDYELEEIFWADLYCLGEEKVNLTLEEMNVIRDDWTEEYLIGIIDADIKRDEVRNITVVGSGTIILK